MLSASPFLHVANDWLPIERLDQTKVDPRLRGWLVGDGLLTDRLKASGAGPFRLRLVEQRMGTLDPEHRQGLAVGDRVGLFRDVEMGCGGQIWVFAESIMPESTLQAHPWLAELGDSALGETLCALPGFERGVYEFRWLPAADGLATRALRHVEVSPAGLWVRRSRLSLRGAPILVHELFLPAIHAG